ncbi:MAG: exodeoxyribonuclease VII small subunit [Thermoplasmata archaeon]|jgi:exodeoxyribonuclease VII small subunit|nr:exodeoxyribonuclease VII small subunit [Thermoplasmata archaeon]
MSGEGEEKDMKFEEAMERLERIVEEMEAGDMSLDEMLAKFEEGMALAKFCRNKIKEAEMKIENMLDELK